jgi:hypothetical protein
LGRLPTPSAHYFCPFDRNDLVSGMSLRRTRTRNHFDRRLLGRCAFQTTRRASVKGSPRSVMSSRKKNKVKPKNKATTTTRTWHKSPIAIAVIPVMVGALLTAFFTFVLGRHSGPAPKIEIDSVQIQPPSQYPTPLKITFQIRNTGNQLAVIHQASLRVLEFESLPICLSQGELPITGQYKADMPASTSPGTVISIPISQQIGPDSADSFALSIRGPFPKNVTISVYRVDMSLFYDNVSTPVDAGPTIFSLPLDPNNQWVWTREDQATRGGDIETMGFAFPQVSRCLIENSNNLEKILHLSGERSTSLAAIRMQMAFCCTLQLPTVKLVNCDGDHPLTRPAELIIGCKKPEELTQMRWPSWKFISADGTGDYCQVNCASANSQKYPVVVHFSNPFTIFTSSYPSGEWVWNNASINFTQNVPAGMKRSTSYSSLAPASKFVPAS